jgi:putative transcriptional regulator
MSDNSLQLENRLLIATPAMGDPRFAQSVILVCAHDENGTMGIVVNKAKRDALGDPLRLSELLEQVGVEGAPRMTDSAVLAGGPVEKNRGFVLHSADYSRDENTINISEKIRMTSSREVLDDLAGDDAPARAVLAVGYAGWDGGQIEREIAENAWIICAPEKSEAMESLVFGETLSDKWAEALAELGIDPAMLSVGGSA